MSRRKASGAPPSAGPSAASGRTSASARRTAPTTPATRAPRAVGSAGGAATGGQLALLREENAAMKQTVEGLEKERDFYFSKLRDIELLLQTAVEENPELEKEENGLIRHVQAILYSTEVSFVKDRCEKNCRIPDLTRYDRMDLRFPRRRKRPPKAMVMTWKPFEPPKSLLKTA